ncbi:hypothetical protein KP509_30G035900 [Ceratopteris richardii]|uniref:C2H2-type domain-containing protein n=1 Tax=Ceratopteris richardii TaxID=49495 RepID=A0A8T2R2G5_CERRI|nr:hypothetical protein KP509_30G035900 [Ceratopteris richardii]
MQGGGMVGSPSGHAHEVVVAGSSLLRAQMDLPMEGGEEPADGEESRFGDAELVSPESYDTHHQQEVMLSVMGSGFSTSVSGHEESGVVAKEEGVQGKKLQYVLRSNPKRSRRLLDPDYNTLHLSSPASISLAPVAADSSSPAASGNPLPSVASAHPKKPTSGLFSEKARACTECGKEFHSWKALFGHMRCHPERQWRGIQPPSISSASLHSQKLRPHYSTPKRGANNIPSSPALLEAGNRIPCTPLLEDSDTESIEAAYMHGRDEQSSDAEVIRKAIRQSERALNRQVLANEAEAELFMDEQDMADCLVMLAFAAKGNEAGTQPVVDDCCRLPDRSGPLSIHSRLPLTAADQKKKKKESVKKRSWSDPSVHKPIGTVDEKVGEFGVDAGDSANGRFQCTSCKKVFRSHQALGGHRASHKKVKGCFARNRAPDEDMAGSPHAQKQEGVPFDQGCKEDLPMEQPFAVSNKKPYAIAAEMKREEVVLKDHGKMSIGEFLQFSMTCNKKMTENSSSDALDKQQLKHQSSSCSSSSSAVATGATMGTAIVLGNRHVPKIHQCSVCQRVFSTGQALGGHKRCHWGSSPALTDGSSSHMVGPSEDCDDDDNDDRSPSGSECIDNPGLDLHVPTSDKMLNQPFTPILAMINPRPTMKGDCTTRQFQIQPSHKAVKDSRAWMALQNHIAEESMVATLMMSMCKRCDNNLAKDGGDCFDRADNIFHTEQLRDSVQQQLNKNKEKNNALTKQNQTCSLSQLPKEERIFDLNLPAQAEDDESTNSDADDSCVVSRASLQAPCPCIRSFLVPAASKNFMGEMEARS